MGVVCLRRLRSGLAVELCYVGCEKERLVPVANITSRNPGYGSVNPTGWYRRGQQLVSARKISYAANLVGGLG